MEHRRSRSLMSRKSSKSPVKNKPSRIFPNPFFNFLKNFRKSNKHKLSVVEITKRGGQLWRRMSAGEKSPYIKLAREAPKYRYRERTRSRKRRTRNGESRRRRYTTSRSSSFKSEETNKCVERRRKKPEIKNVGGRARKPDKNQGKIKQNGDKCESGNKTGEMRPKSIDYDDIRRDYI
ncbi:hypothetical protein JTB14_020330 [Gonioctena quinquepunctata]|nr:hypothetical protein JTB14_020330 [Gonioctena quinquepunctata]